MLAENPRPLTAELMSARIYSPFAYPLPRHTQIVPIAAAEAERLGASFPIVWRKGPEGPQLVALRSLLPDGDGFAPGTAGVLALLPLVFQAYPFLLPERGEGEAEPRRMVDAAVPDEPNDAGAAITGADGRLSRGTELRLRALELYERDRPRTLAIGRAVEARGFLEPWPLRFDLGHGQRCEILDLFVVAQKTFDTPALAPLLAEFGVAAARLLGQHRLSLFRAGPLLAAAQGAVAARARGGAA
ncbi:SapC family protein [Aurantimonas sp. Leaf443]|uniref:SapC family protein n=1 Tax=Aurantimonas sp. Leaf443 TaxID=1736378 RepID=UPI0006FAA4F2|nr:SapC family protein [Aurantimonas sp. Leaf443]KQT82830.1 hypothetical protein ASG48_15195 [Aurantimonas sp. Leaf443]